MARNSLTVEFTIRAQEDLYLQGSCRTIARVRAGDIYPCQMQKTQTFSCLFRHYAKHNGLRKDDLAFYFVDELLPEGTPESEHLLQNDEIVVALRKKTDVNLDITTANTSIANESSLGSDLRSMLYNAELSDVSFIYPLENMTEEEARTNPLQCTVIPAHKAILVARCAYFYSMFTGRFAETTSIIIDRTSFNLTTYRLLLEYLYTNEIKHFSECSASTSGSPGPSIVELDLEEVLKLLHCANLYIIPGLQALCEKFIGENGYVKVSNVCRLAHIAEMLNATTLRLALQNFIISNVDLIRADDNVRKEIVMSPELALLLVDSVASNNEPISFGSRIPALKRLRGSDSGDAWDVVGAAGSRPRNSLNPLNPRVSQSPQVEPNVPDDQTFLPNNQFESP